MTMKNLAGMGGFLFSALVSLLIGLAPEHAHATTADGCETAQVNADSSFMFVCNFPDGGSQTITASAPVIGQGGEFSQTISGEFNIPGTSVGNFELNFASNPSLAQVSYFGSGIINGTEFEIDCTIDQASAVVSGTNCGALGLLAGDTSGLTAIGSGQTDGGTQLPPLTPVGVTQIAAELVDQGVSETREAVQRDQVRALNNILSSRFRSLTGAMVRGNLTADSDQVKYADALAKRSAGKSAGDEIMGMGVWLDGAVNYLDIDHLGAETDGRSTSIIGGLDYALEDDIIIGGFAGYQGADLDLDFTFGHQDTDGIVVGAYVAYILDDATTIDVNLSYSRLNNDIDVVTAGVVGEGSYDARRLSGAINLNHYYGIDDWLLTSSAGFAYSREKADSYTLSNGNFVSSDSVSLGLLSPT